jgi:hypothetical protein
MKSNQQALLELYNALGEDQQRSLLDYAEFLQSKAETQHRQISEPIAIPRPENETVVGAIKRLKQSYPMVDSMEVFAVASNLMTDHMVKGRDADEVISEIEALFEDSYQKILREFE